VHHLNLKRQGDLDNVKRVIIFVKVYVISIISVYYISSDAKVFGKSQHVGQDHNDLFFKTTDKGGFVK
jgi:hypothetical protein